MCPTPLPWSPLARGRLTRDWQERSTRSEGDVFGRSLYRDGDREVAEAVAEVAMERGVPRAQVAMAWVASRPGVSEKEVRRLEGPYRPRRAAGF